MLAEHRVMGGTVEFCRERRVGGEIGGGREVAEGQCCECRGPKQTRWYVHLPSHYPPLIVRLP